MDLTIGFNETVIKITRKTDQFKLPSGTNECIVIDKNGQIVPVTIVGDDHAIVTLKDGSKVEGKLLSSVNGVLMENEDGRHHFVLYESLTYDDDKVVHMPNQLNTLNFRTNLINWTPRIIVKVDEKQLHSTLLAIISNEYQQLDTARINLIGEYQQQNRSPSPRRMAMLSRSMAPMSMDSPVSENSPMGQFAYSLDEIDYLNYGDNILSINEYKSIEYEEHYQARLYNGRQLAQRIISYKSPDDYPAGKYTFILPSGVQLDAGMEEVQEGQEIKQSIGPSSNVVIKTTMLANNKYQAKINARINCKVIIVAPYVDKNRPSISSKLGWEEYNDDGNTGWMVQHKIGESISTIQL